MIDEGQVEIDWDDMQLMLDDLDVYHIDDDEDGGALSYSHDGTYPPSLLLQQHHPDSHFHASQLPPDPNPNLNLNALTPTRTHTEPTKVTPRGLQTVNPSGQPQSVAPPLLPAFLITGLLLGAILFIIIWRHFVERRRSTLRSFTGAEDEDVFGGGGEGGDGTREKPRMWEAFTTVGVSEGVSDSGVKEKWEGWESVMPLSATPFFGPPKKQQPRYLMPSDRPTTFMTRMFGGGMEGYRFNSRGRIPASTMSASTGIGMGFTGGSAGGPLMSSIAYTNRQGPMLSASHSGTANTNVESGKAAHLNEESENRIEKVLLSFVVSMPVERNNRDSEMRKRKSKDDVDVSVQSDELPELCLGSLMIPYG